MQLLNEDEQRAWDQYAAGALAVCAAASGQIGHASTRIAEMAAGIADRLIAERRKREPDRMTPEGLRIPNPHR